jgi:hypothetical protein
LSGGSEGRLIILGIWIANILGEGE